MSRNAGNKKRGAQPRGSSGGGGSKHWPFFVGGLLLGLLLAGGVYLLEILPTAMELRERAKAEQAACADAPAAAKKGDKAADAKGAKADGEPVKFQFYTMLPQQEVVAPVAGDKTTVATPPPLPPEDKPAAAADKPAAEKPAAGAARFQLQAGSFRTRQEADRRRAELVLSGLSVSVQNVKTGSGEEWFRVMVGPFGSEADMQKARQQLSALKVDTLPIRLR